jgi:hypothetical protein
MAQVARVPSSGRAGARRSAQRNATIGRASHSAGRSRCLANVDWSVSPPPNSREPGAGDGNGCGPQRPRPRHPPAVEPAGRRPRVEPTRARDVFPPVLEYVDERVSNLAWRRQSPGVMAIAPDHSVSAESAIHRPCNADRKSLESACERRGPVRLHQQVQMIRLHRELEDAKARSRRSGECPANGSEEPSISQRGYSRPDSQRRVRRTSGIVRHPTAMRNAGTASRCRLPARSGSTATPRAND